LNRISKWVDICVNIPSWDNQVDPQPVGATNRKARERIDMIKVDVMCRSSHPGFHSVVYQTENVPQDAIAMPISKIEPSNLLHFLSMAIFALMGPMTQMRKEKREPRRPIIELNSGMAIETATVSTAIRVR